MKAPRRFRLSGLLLLVTATAVFFGYAQWRRQSLVREIDRLKSEGVEMAELNGDWFWPRVQGEATVTIECKGLALFSHQGKALTTAQAKERFRNLASQLREMGINDVWYCVTVSNSGGGGICRMRAVDYLEDQTRELIGQSEVHTRNRTMRQREVQ